MVHSATFITQDDVTKFLQSQSLEEYITVFQEEQVDGPHLLNMIVENDTKLKDLVADSQHQSTITKGFLDFVEKGMNT